MVTSTTEGDTVDLEAAMLSQGDDDDDVYGKKYLTTPEDRTDRSAARAKQKEDREKQEQERKALQYAEAQLQKEVEERRKKEAQQALLEEEEKGVEERRKLSEQKQKGHLERKATELQKQKERERKRREKRKKKKCDDKIDEEEEAMIDDTDKDKDYNPDDDPEADFVVEDQDMDDEDTFEVEKHVHALNFEEAGDYLVSMNRYMEAFSKIVRRGKEDVAREYKKLIKFVKLMIEKLGAYSPIEAADVEAVFETVVDPQCVAWRRAQHGTKTGNSKEILRVEEKRWKVEKSIEEREISPDEQVQTFADTMTVKSKTERAEVIRMIKRYFGHVARAHEEAASAARIAQELVDEVDENSWLQIVSNGTRPLVMLQVPEMMQQAAMMKTIVNAMRRQSSCEDYPLKILSKNKTCRGRWSVGWNPRLCHRRLTSQRQYIIFCTV